MKTLSDRDISKYSFGVTGHFRSYRDNSADFSFHSVIDCLAMKLDENEMLCFFSDLTRFRYGVHEIFVFYTPFDG